MGHQPKLEERMVKDTIEQLEERAAITLEKMREANEGTTKFVQEANKARDEEILATKKTKWIQFTIVLGLVATIITVTIFFN